jgi:hypothetical protein
MKEALVIWNGDNLQACYLIDTFNGKDLVIIVDETGDGGGVWLEEFSRAQRV